MSAAVPDPLSFAPGAVPRLSRWAMTTISPDERTWPATAGGRAMRLSAAPGAEAWDVGVEGLLHDVEVVRGESLGDPVGGLARA